MNKTVDIGWRNRVIALLLPFVACAVQWVFWDAIQPFVWFLFFPTVFLSSRIGGMREGLLATLMSVAFVWFFFIPPQLSFQLQRIENVYSVFMFLIMGGMFTVTHDRLRRESLRVANALEATHKAHMEISRLYAKTRELDELKSQFFANVSHELRTPLTLILGPISKWLGDGRWNPDERRALEIVHRNAKLLYRHVCDLLDVSRLDSHRMEIQYVRTDLAQLVRLTGSYFDVLAAEKYIDFALLAPNSLYAEVDPEKIQRILLNLLSNAFKFTPTGGRIELRLGSENDQVRIQVQDNGPGIPAELRDSVFERFRQVEGGTTRSFEGTGLGLSIAKEFAELHLGKIDLAEAPGGGALFSLILPMAAPRGAVVHIETAPLNEDIARQLVSEIRPADYSQAPAYLPGDAPLVLVVEDHPDMNAYIRQSLANHFRVACAFDGRQGLTKALELHPEAIVTDLMMPDVGGDQMIRSLRLNAETHHVPILVLTAKADEDLRLSLLREGVQEYLLKPFSSEELLIRVNALIAEHRQNREALEKAALLNINLSQELQVERAKLETAIENMGIGVGMCDRHGTFVMMNSVCLKLHGFSSQADMFLHLDQYAREWTLSYSDGAPMPLHEWPLARALRGDFVHEYEALLRHTDTGRTWSCNYNAAPVYDYKGDIRLIIFTLQDISERKKTEQSLRDRNRELAVLCKISEIALRDQSLQEMLGEIARETAAVTGFPVSAIELYDEPNQRMEFVAATGIPMPEYPGRLLIPVEKTLSGTVARTAQPLFESHLPERAEYADDTLRKLRLQTFACVPAILHSRVIGTLAIAHTDCIPESNNLLSLLANIANLLATVIEYKRAEAALRASEERFRRAIIDAPSPIMLHAEDGQVIQISQSWLDISGYPAEELTTISDWTERAYGEKQIGVRENIDRLYELNQRIYEGDFDIRTRSGETRIWEFSSSALGRLPDGRRMVMSMAADVTDRRIAESALRESEVRYRQLAESLEIERAKLLSILTAMPDGVYITNNAYEIEYINPAIERDFGPIEGRKCYEYFHDGTTPCSWCRNEEIFAGRSVRWEWYSEKTRKTYDLFDTPVHNADGSISKLELFHDITDRKEAEQLLRQKNEQLDLTLQSTGVGIWHWDIATNRLYSDRQSLQLVGIDPDSFRGTLDEFFHVVAPDDLDAVRAAIDRSLAQDIPYKSEYGVMGPDRTLRLISARGTISRDPEGRPIRLDGVSWDITERRSLEQQLIQAQKMEAVGHLAGGVAHDFNNILQVILVSAEILGSNLEPNTPAREALDEVCRAAERATDLIRQLLAFSRRQIIRPVHLDLNELVQGILKMIQRLIGEHIELCFIPGTRLTAIFADKGQIDQVLMNLCVNARDAMPKGGRITIETRSEHFDADYCRQHPWAKEGAYALLRVRDTGEGMDAAILAHIFDPFFTTKELGKGTGLGLATVYGIVQQHFGLLHVESEPGQGSTFNIYLPAVEREVLETAQELPPAAAGGAETLLVAEDDRAILKMLTMLLQAAGYTVLSAANGKEALRLFDENAEIIDMAILDVVMPECSGKEVMDRIQAKGSQIPFLFTSGYSESAIHTDFVIQEGLHLVPKPYSKDILLREIRKILDDRNSA